MRNKFDEQLEKLNDKLIKMGKDIEILIIDATNSLIQRNAELAQEVIDFYPEIENQEREIESLCLKLLLKQQPVATDLRIISSTLKIITDMRRIRSTRNGYCTINNISNWAKWYKRI